jgi:hypothetical protein
VSGHFFERIGNFKPMYVVLRSVDEPGIVRGQRNAGGFIGQRRKQ